MSLYVRVHNSFWNHRKTLRLRARIGEAAYWIPPRLWSYAADNQPNGDFSDYSAEEMAMLIGYMSDATSMLEALQQAGFMDSMRIHDWHEHNGYHSTFSERGKKAAAARWKGKGNDKKGNDKKGKETSIATSMLVAWPSPSPIALSPPKKGRADSLSIVVDYGKSIGVIESDSSYFWNSQEAGGWLRNGKPIKDWQACLRTWKDGRFLPSQKPDINGSKFSKLPDPKQAKHDQEYEEAQARWREKKSKIG